jgi:small ligand-binding sensory domain FIST
MPRFIVGHATHPDWKGALSQAAAQLERQHGGQEASLGLVYFTDHYAPHAQALYDALHARWPGVAWAGTVGIGVCASGVEYFDEPALVLMLSNLPQGRFRVFSGARPLGQIEPATALVHADAREHDLAELLDDLSARTSSGYLFGGVAASRTHSCQIAEGVYEGGLSGVAFTRDVGIVSRVTQGCQPIGPRRRITGAERNVVTELDGQPALQCLLDDLRLTLDEPPETATDRPALSRTPTAGRSPRSGGLGGMNQAMLALRETLVGLAAPSAPMPVHATVASQARHRAFGDDVRVRHLVGLDPGRNGVAVADMVEPGMTLAFCHRDVAAARRDLTRICAEIREELTPEPAELATAAMAAPAAPTDGASRIRGAVYVSCAGRGGPHFGAPSAELQIIRHALGDVPLAGFFAGGEIGHQHLYGYTGVLTVFTGDS